MDGWSYLLSSERNDVMKKLIGVGVIIVFIFVGLVTSVTYAETKIGFDWSYGKDGPLPDDWKSEKCDNTVNRFSFRIETNSIIPSWESVFLGAELRYSMHKADETKFGPFGLGHDAGFREQGLNATVKKEWGWFYAGAFAGLSYTHERDNRMHQLTDNGNLLGTWGPIVGLNVPITGPWELRFEGRISHTSGPFERDRGKNLSEATLGLTYVFPLKRGK